MSVGTDRPIVGSLSHDGAWLGLVQLLGCLLSNSCVPRQHEGICVVSKMTNSAAVLSVKERLCHALARTF